MRFSSFTIILRTLIFMFLFPSSLITFGYDISWYDDLSSKYYISSSDGLQGLYQLCNQGKSFEGKTIYITQDIDMKNISWLPIDEFSGKIDGQGFTIHNLSFSKTSPHTGKYVASFCVKLSENGEITNIGFINENMELHLEYGSAHVAGIVYENRGKVSNCIVHGTINASFKGSTSATFDNYYAGGVVGYNYGKVYNCSFAGYVTSYPSHYSQYPQAYAGGIVGYNEGEIINCVNSGAIYSRVGYDSTHWNGIPGAWPHAYSGGICGGNNSIIDNVVNYGNVTATSYRLGNSEGSNAYASAIVGQGECGNAYYLSSCLITAPHIIPKGTMLSESQMKNVNFNFTMLLNENVANLNNDDIQYWANAASYNDNIPFAITIFSLNNQITSVNQNSAVFSSIPIDISSDAFIMKGFEYKKLDAQSYQRINVNDNTFQTTVSGLDISSNYVMRSFIQTKNTTIYSNAKSFVTNNISIETLPATSITTTSATLNGKMSVGSSNILSQGFLWKKDIDESYTIEYTDGEVFSKVISSLTANTSYVFQAFIVTLDGTSHYGNEMIFKTEPISLTLSVSQNADPTTCEILGLINIPVKTNVVIEYKQQSESGYQKIVSESNEDGTFYQQITDLVANTNYIIRAYIFYNNTYYYSENTNYKTLSPIVYTLLPSVGSDIVLNGKVLGAIPNGIVGFEYRQTMHPNAIPSTIRYAELKNTEFSIHISDVINNEEYKYRAFYKDANKNYFYGDWQIFIPTMVDPTGMQFIYDSTKSNARRYNINGIPVGINYKGLIIENGKLRINQ